MSILYNDQTNLASSEYMQSKISVKPNIIGVTRSQRSPGVYVKNQGLAQNKVLQPTLHIICHMETSKGRMFLIEASPL